MGGGVRKQTAGRCQWYCWWNTPRQTTKKKVQERNGVSEALNWQVLRSLVSQKSEVRLIAGVKKKTTNTLQSSESQGRDESGSSYLRGRWSAAIGSFSACRYRRKTAPARLSPPSCCGREGPPPLCRTAGAERMLLAPGAIACSISICTSVGNKVCKESRCTFLF